MQRFRVGPAEVEKRIGSQADIDGPNVPVRIEQEPGSAGVIAMDHSARQVLQGRDFRGVRSTGSKAERARPLAAAISNGLVSLRSEAPWVRDLTNELRSFPVGTHDDQVDAMSGAMAALTQQDRVQSVLPRSLLQLCVDAYRKYEREIGRIVAAERPFVGFRIAETNADRTSMVTRIGQLSSLWSNGMSLIPPLWSEWTGIAGRWALLPCIMTPEGQGPVSAPTSGKYGGKVDCLNTQWLVSTSAPLSRGPIVSLCEARPTGSILPGAVPNWLGR